MIKNLLETLRRMWGRISVGRLASTLIYLVLMLTSIWYTQTHTGRAQRGIGFVLMIVFAVLFIRSIKRLLSEEIQELLEEALEKIGAIIFFPAAWCIRKIAKFLGMVNVMADLKGVDLWVNFTETDEGILCELRSSGRNINPVAVKYGGGGHAKASGATVPDRDTAMQMLEDLNLLMGEPV